MYGKLSLPQKGGSQSELRFKPIQAPTFKVWKYTHSCGPASISLAECHSQVIWRYPLSGSHKIGSSREVFKTLFWAILVNSSEAKGGHREGLHQPSSPEPTAEGAYLCSWWLFRPRNLGRKLGRFHRKNRGGFQPASCEVPCEQQPEKSCLSDCYSPGTQITLATRASLDQSAKPGAPDINIKAPETWRAPLQDTQVLWNAAEGEYEDSTNPLSLWEILQLTLDACLIRSLLLRLKLC